MWLTLWSANKLQTMRLSRQSLGFDRKASTGVARIDVRLIKEKTYRYRDDSVPFLRNIQNIVVANSYLEVVIEYFFR